MEVYWKIRMKGDCRADWTGFQRLLETWLLNVSYQRFTVWHMKIRRCLLLAKSLFIEQRWWFLFTHRTLHIQSKCLKIYPCYCASPKDWHLCECTSPIRTEVVFVWTNYHVSSINRVAGTAGAVVTCPLEVVKTRLQSSNAFMPASRISELPGLQNPTSDALRRPEQRRKFSSTILRRVRPQVKEILDERNVIRFISVPPSRPPSLFFSLFRSRSHRRKLCAKISSIKFASKWM